MRYYDFDIDREKRLIKVKLWGFWNQRIAEDYYKDFEIAIHPLLGSKWSRIVDINEYKSSSIKVADVLDRQLEWAKEKKMEFNVNILGDLFERLQLKSKLASNNQSKQNLVFGSIEEALKWLSEQGY